MKRILLLGLVLVLGAWTVASAQDIRWDPQFATDLNGQVNAILVQGTDVYVGGSFTTAGGTTVNRIARWDGSTWHALGQGVNSTVYALAWYNDSLWVGGDFTEAGGPGQYATCIAKWDGTTWYPVGGTNGGAVRAMETTSSGLYIGGAFSSIGSLGTANYLAKYEGGGVWSDVGSGTNGVVMTLTEFGGDTLFVGGIFTAVAGSATLAYSAAKWDGSAWYTMGGVEFSTTVRASVAIGDTLYIGGDFTNVSDGTVPAIRVARYVNRDWSTVGSGFDASVHSLHLVGSVLYAGGSFLNSGATGINRIAEWNGSSWSGLGSGTDATVYALGSLGYNVYAGGSFLNAGGKASAYFGSYQGTLAPPTLVNPASGAYVTETPALDWTDVTGAATYHLQIATNASFSSIIHDQSGIATSSYDVPAATLSGVTQYYWRVATVNVAGESPWSASRSFTTSIIAPTLASPPPGAATSTTPILDWNDITGASSYTVQMSTASDFSSLALNQTGVATSTLTVSSGILSPSTTYYWRVLATNSNGDGPWATSRTLTTSIIAPTLSSPLTGGAVSATPTLDWNAVVGATAYQLQVDNNSDFSSPVLNLTSIPSPTYTVSSGVLTENTTYYWRVSASNPYGSSGYSAEWNFNTSIVAPTLVNPAAAAYVTVTPALDWSDVTGAATYRVQVSTAANFSAIVLDQAGLGTSNFTVTPALNASTVYYWRAAAVNTYGQGPWSAGRNFTTSIIAPTLSSPPNAAATASTPVLDWTDITGATSYRLQISTTSGFTSNIVDQSGIVPSTYTVPAATLSDNVTYYWRVLATNTYGDGPWATYRSFTTSIVAPLLAGPPDGSAVTVTPTLDWGGVTGATDYRVQISTVANFASTVLDSSSIGSSTVDIPPGALGEETTYYWRVAASNAYGESPWSSSRTFTTSIVAPALVSPALAAAVTTTPTLDWTDVTGSTSYRVQVSTSATFTSTAVDQAGIVSSTYTVGSGPLSDNTLYYWRVAAVNAIGQGPWSTSRTMTTSIVAPTLASPDNAAAVTVTPTLDWGDITGATAYHLQISTSATFTSTVVNLTNVVASTYTVGAATLSANTQYYWRVASLNTNGESPFSGSRSFTTSIIAPTLATPADLATVTTTPTLDWNDVTGATSYRVQISTSSGFTTTVVDQAGLATSTLTVGSGLLAENTEYYWRVLASNTYGDGPYSAVRTFTTSIVAPVLVSPAAAAAVTTTPTLDWNNVTGATSYRVQISTSATFTTTVLNQGGIATSTLTVPGATLAENTQYYWRVLATGAYGDGPYSAGRTFTTSIVAPTLVTPANAAAVTVIPTLDWSDITGATAYHLQVSTSATFTTTVIDLSSLASSTYSVPGGQLSENTQYYWRVASLNTNGESPYSASRTFTTSIVAPTLTSPANAAAVTVTPTLDWDDVTGATSYRVQISTSAGFATTVLDQSGVVSSTLTVGAATLSANTQYYWRVLASSANGDSPYSTSRTFTTSIVAPTLVSPAAAAAVTTGPTLDWNDVTGAATYRVQVSTNAGFTTTVLDSSGLAASTVALPSGRLAEATQHYWRVAAVNTYGQGPWSSGRDFTTSIVAPGLVSPPAAAAVTITPSLDWSDVAGATAYHVQISANAGFTTTVLDQSNVTNSNLTVSSGTLSNSTQYYWRVASSNTNGESPFSTARTFTTSVIPPTLVSPAAAAAVTPTPVLDWSDVTGATSYRLQISTVASFTSTVIDQSNISGSTYTVSSGALAENTQYYWRVASANTYGESPFSTGRDFTTSIVAPSLVSPAAAAAVTTTPVLDWANVTGATSYAVQVSTSAAFTTTVVNQSGLTNSTYTIASGVLLENTQYYWRAAASNTNGQSPWSAGRDFTTSIVAPTLVSPAAAAAVTTTPTLDWGNVTGATEYRVQISTNASFSTLVLDSTDLGTSAVTIPAGTLASNTQYYWRVSASSIYGESPFSTSRDFTTSVIAPAPISPPAASATTTTPTLDWSDVTGATSYRLQISTSATFGSTVVDQSNIASSTLSISSGVLTASTQYYWRVAAVNANGQGPWSTVFDFTTSIIAPTLVAPPAAAAVTVTPTLDWSDITGAASYRVQISTAASFATTVLDQSGISASTVTVASGTLSASTQYYWRAAAVNANGQGPWSANRNFTTSIVAPSLVSPPAAAAVTTTPTLDWNDITGATSYHVQVSTSASFSSTVVDQSGISGSTVTIAGGVLSESTQYYWRAAAVNANGEGPWSSSRDFTTSIVAPTLVSPLAAANVTATPTLDWNDITGATSYRIQISTSASFTSPVLDQSGLAASILTVSGGTLNDDTQYYWRAAAVNANGQGPWSTSRDFTTSIVAPTLVAPPAASAVTTTPTLDWGNVTGATSYRLQISTTSSFTSTVMDTTGVLGSVLSVPFGRLTQNTQYYWRVAAVNTYGDGPWSASWDFTTSVIAPALISPPAAAAVTTTPTLDWNDVTGANTYRLQVSLSSTFSTTVIDSSGLASSTMDVPASRLSENTQYHWRVAAVNAIGQGPWSSSRDFTTSIVAPTLVSPPAAAAVTTTPTLDWDDVTGATAYRVQVSTSATFASTVVDQPGITNSTLTISAGVLTEDTQYYWRALASNANGTGPWSAGWDFTTSIVAPTLVAPPAAAAVTTTPALDWSDVTGATSYHIQVSTTSAFSTTAFDSAGVSGTNLTVTFGALAENTQYYWRVAAANVLGEGPWSTSRDFVTSLVAPGLISPPAAAAVTTTPILDWSDVSGATSYHIQISAASDFAATVIDSSGLSLSVMAVPAGRLWEGGQFYWRVASVNSLGQGPWSASRDFSTSLVQPTLVSPSANAVNVALNAPIVWRKISGATKYRLQIATDPTFASGIALDDSTVTDTVRAASGLSTLTTYYWRVRASSDYGTGPFSGSRQFTTIPALPAQVLLVSPANSASFMTDTVRFVWRASTPAVANYRLEYSTDPTFVTITFVDSTLTDTTFTALAVPTGVYHWRVRAENAAGYGAFSATRSFDRIVNSVADAELPLEFDLGQNYPNPFNPTTTIEFAIPKTSQVSLKIYNNIGEEVATLVSEEKTPGRYSVQWNGRGAASGVYYYRIVAGDFVVTKKLVLLK